MYGNTPVKSLNIHNFEMDTNSATVQPSDLQAGVTCFARGQKITGTGKSFEFATYGNIPSNEEWPIPSETINVVQITNLDYPTQSVISLNNINDIDFTTAKTVSNIIVDGTTYPVKVVAANHMFTVICDININFQIFYGKDNYV